MPNNETPRGSLAPDTAQQDVDRVYLIQKGGAYYRGNSRGYTNSALTAGRYTLSEAESISHPNGPDGPRDNMRFIHEDDARCENLDFQRAAIAALSARVAELEASIQQERAAKWELLESPWKLLATTARDDALREVAGLIPETMTSGSALRKRIISLITKDKP